MARALSEEELNAIDAKYSSGNPMRAVANMANQMTPSHALQVYKASLSSGYAPELVATNLPAYKENEFDKIDWQDVMTASPKTYQFLANPMRLAAMGTVKNVSSLAGIENEWKVTTAIKNSFKDLSRGILGSGIASIESARLTANENSQEESSFGVNKAANLLTGITSNTLSAFVTPVLKKARDSELLQSKEVKGDTWVGQLGLDATQQVAQLAMQLAAAYFSGGATVPTLLTGAYTAGSKYNKLTEEGVEARRAWQAGVMDAAAQAPFERIGIGKIMKKTPTGGSMAKEILEKALTEGITEWIQKYPEAITEIWAKNPAMTAQERTDEFIKNFWEITKEGAYEGLIGAILGGAGGTVSLSVQKQVLDNTIASMETQQQVLAGIDIDPVIKKDMLNNILDGQKIYVDPQALLTLYQDGLFTEQELDNMLGIDGRTVAANTNKGQLVEVPLANYQVAASQHPEIHQVLKDDIATDEDGYTSRGLKVRNERDIKKYGEKVRQQRDETKAAADDVMKQWVASGALSQQDAKTVMAALISHARIYSSNPAQFIREKAPMFAKGVASPDGALQQYAGTSAQTADKLKLSQAQQMEMDGADNEAIRQATGWFKGMDGKWRFEIDDSKATLTLPDSSKLQSKLQALEAEYAPFDARDEIWRAPARKIASRIFDIKNKIQQIEQKTTLGDLIKHPALYKAYPNLKQITVYFDDNYVESGDAYFDGAHQSIHIRSSSKNRPGLLQLILHEIQHSIQSREGFARGGSPEMMDARDKERRDLISGHEENLKLWREDISATKFLQDLMQKYLAGEIEATDLPRLFSEWENNSPVGGAIKALKEELKRLYEAYPGTPFEAYQRLAGEIEARDTANRAGLSPEQRKETAPDLRSDAIVVWGGKEYAYQQETIEVNGTELGDWSTPNELRKKAAKYYSDHLQGTSTMHPVLGAIQFSGSGKRKVIATSGNPDKLLIIPKLRKIIASANYVGAEDNTKPNKRENIKQYHWLVADVILAGNPKRLGIKVFEDNNGNFFYNYNFIEDTKIEDPLVSRAQNPQRGPRVSADNESSSIISIPQPGELFQYPNQTDSPAFKDWFGGSKVVDEQGNPLVVYHTGTMGDVYDMTKSRSYSGSPDYEIPGIYLTADKAESQEYGTPEQTKALYVSIQNPYEGDIYELHKQLGTWRTVMDHLIEQGYDGIINDDGYGEIIAFHPEQIKSATKNQGTYGPNNSNIYMQGQNDPKGAIHWDEQGRAIITMFQNADASTVIHEMVGHYFIQNLLDEGAKSTAPDWMKADRQKALDWAASQDVARELTKLMVSAEGKNNQEAVAMFRDALAYVESGGQTTEAATDSGHDHHQALRAAYHELLARAGEAYIMEGKAPSAEMRPLFRRFTEWLIEIYQDIKALGVTLSPEIRGVFDRMIATETEIKRMAETEGYLQQLPDNIYNNLTDKQKAEMDKLLANVEDIAKEQVRAQLMLYYTADNQYRIKEEETAALARITAATKEEPLYKAEAAIEEAFGKKAKAVAQSYVGYQLIPFGATPIAETIAIKRKLLERMIETGYEEGIAGIQQEIDALVQKEAARKANQLQAAQQAEFEFIAELHGFTSGDHLAQDLIAYNDSETTIRNRLEDHMTVFKEQLTDEEALHKNIEEAMYSDDGALLLAAEQQIIDEKLGRIIAATDARQEALRLREVARQSAAGEVASLSLDKVMNLNVWISAERRAAENAQKALAKGDLQAARDQKAIQLFNHQMVQESLKARREFDRITKFLKRQKKSGRDTWMSDEISADGTRSVTDIHFIQGADLLRRLGFGRSDYVAENNLNDTLGQYAAKMAEKNPDMVNLPEWLIGRKEDKINLRSLRLDQLKDVEGALRNIKKMAAEGRDANRFSVLSGNTVEELAAKLIDTAAPLPDALVDMLEKEEVSGIDKFQAGLQRPDQNFLKLDGMQEDGPWTKAFYAALSAAQNVKSKLQRTVYEAIDMAYTEAGVDREERQRNAHRLIYIPEWGQSVRKNTLLAMLLNMGSQSNKDRMFQSRPVGLDINHEANWNERELRAVLTKYLEPRDFKLAQGIWDAINLLYAPYNDMVRMMTGRTLEKVEALPLTFTLPDGRAIYLRGGYYPLKQDTRATMQAELNFEKSTMETYVGVMPYANAGASKSRVHGAKYAVDFDVDNLWRHVTDVTHDISFRPVMHDINKLLRHDGVRETLRHKLGEANYKVILDWYKAIATAKDATVDNLLNSFMSFARTATTIKNLLFRPMTIVQNLANFTLYGNAVRGFSEQDALRAYLQYGWGEYIPHAISNSAKAKEIRAWVYQKSPMMRDKMESPDYTVRDIKETGYDNRLMKSSNEAVFKAGMAVSFTQEKVIEFGSQMLAWMDQLTDIPVFRGAYFQAIAQGKTEQEAIRFAEAVISRTTGSGRKIDTSQMQRGTTTEKALTMFLTFLNTQYNRWVMEGRIFLSERDYWRLMKFVGIKFLTFGALSAILSGKLPDTDDEDGWEKWFFGNVISWPLGMVPVGGSVAKVILDTAIGNKTFGYSMSPVEQNIEEAIKLFSTAKRYTEGKATTPEILERGSGVASFFLRYPDQFNDWFWNAYDIIQGNMEPELRDLARRRPRKER